MIPVEQLARIAVTGVPNAYCLILFACCREVKKLSQFEVNKFQREQQDSTLTLVSARGETVLTKTTCNIFLSFGCQPSFGVQADSKYVKDFINLITSNFDESGSVILPDVFSRVVS